MLCHWAIPPWLVSQPIIAQSISSHQWHRYQMFLHTESWWNTYQYSLVGNDEGNCSYLRQAFCKQTHMLEMSSSRTHDRFDMCFCLHFIGTKVTAVTFVVPYQWYCCSWRDIDFVYHQKGLKGIISDFCFIFNSTWITGNWSDTTDGHHDCMRQRLEWGSTLQLHHSEKKGKICQDILCLCLTQLSLCHISGGRQCYPAL